MVIANVLAFSCCQVMLFMRLLLSHPYNTCRLFVKASPRWQQFTLIIPMDCFLFIIDITFMDWYYSLIPDMHGRKISVQYSVHLSYFLCASITIKLMTPDTYSSLNVSKFDIWICFDHVMWHFNIWGCPNCVLKTWNAYRQHEQTNTFCAKKRYKDVLSWQPAAVCIFQSNALQSCWPEKQTQEGGGPRVS